MLVHRPAIDIDHARSSMPDGLHTEIIKNVTLFNHHHQLYLEVHSVMIGLENPLMTRYKFQHPMIQVAVIIIICIIIIIILMVKIVEDIDERAKVPVEKLPIMFQHVVEVTR